MKTFNEGLSVFNKCFPGIASRKRSRSDALSGERSSGLFLNDHSAMGPTVGKMGALNHTIASGFELDQQKPEERTKNAIPNKRTRTSIGDPRVCILILYIFSFLCFPGCLLVNFHDYCDNDKNHLPENSLFEFSFLL